MYFMKKLRKIEISNPIPFHFRQVLQQYLLLFRILNILKLILNYFYHSVSIEVQNTYCGIVNTLARLDEYEFPSNNPNTSIDMKNISNVVFLELQKF